MHYRQVGNSGLKISEIGLGSWLTYGKTVQRETAKKCLTAAVNHEVNFIDTAEIYAKGGAEEVIGEWLEEETIDRNDLVISSKVFWPMSENVNDWGLSRKNIMKAIDGTLGRLGTNYLDIYYMHRFDPKTPLRETVMALDDLVRRGKIHYWGTSVWTAAQLERVHAVAREMGAHAPTVEQPMYNMLFRHIETEIMPVAHRLGMGFTVWSPLYQGILTGKYNEGIPEGSRGDRSPGFLKYLTDKWRAKLNTLEEIANSMDITMTQLALAWILRRPEISSAIIGATKPEHVAENTGASGVKLSDDVVERIEEVLDNRPEWPKTYTPNVYHEDETLYYK
ncbi:MAG: aldo/keto reductase family protein [Candidatus Thorarchaeota archaeon]